MGDLGIADSCVCLSLHNLMMDNTPELYRTNFLIIIEHLEYLEHKERSTAN